MKRVKVFGERNCGTNYLLQLLSLNCDNDILRGTVPGFVYRMNSEWTKDLYFRFTTRRNFGWKHRKVDPREFLEYEGVRDTLFITITKNPYSFLLSLHRRPHHYAGSVPSTFSEFLDRPWSLRARDAVGSSSLSSPVELWNVKNGSYLELRRAMPDQTHNMKYETLLRDPKETLGEIADRLGIVLHRDFKNVETSTKGDDKSFVDYQSYYLSESWMGKLEPGHIRTINARLDQDTLARYDYTQEPLSAP